MKKHKILFCVLLVFAIIISLFLLGFWNPLVSKSYNISSEEIPPELDGLKVVQITDFHCKDFGMNEDDLIELVKKAEPDLIALTGDIVDEDHSTDNARYLLEGISDVAPIYYVTGNHEYYPGAPFNEFKGICNEYGVTILQNETVDFNYNGTIIKISGLDFVDSTKGMKVNLSYADPDYYNILLYHDSSQFDYISAFDYDLVLCGHIHGGLIRIPFLGGLLGSDYHFFPKYDYGKFQKYNSLMISSSGLGDARIARWNNPREIVKITLHSKQ